MDLRDLQQAGFQRAPRIIKNSTIFDKQRQVPVIINALNPANTIAASGKLIRANRLEFDPRATFNFRFKRLNPYALQRVFGFGIFTIGSVTQSR